MTTASSVMHLAPNSCELHDSIGGAEKCELTAMLTIFLFDACKSVRLNV